MHYWCLPELHTKFHIFAATSRSAATFWNIGCLQQSLKLNQNLLQIVIKQKVVNGMSWNCFLELHTKFHVSAATRRSAAACWNIGCYQQFVKFIKYLAEILYFASLELLWLFWKCIPIKRPNLRLAICLAKYLKKDDLRLSLLIKSLLI